uniref:U3 small nucleolar RNA-associated protein 13 C-terminal domain-containing protein n=1 Tax=Plectus sambesii TaxID=2011161 RepID=A0A914XEE8_9BILA
MPADLVTNFAITRSVEAFFTGGQVQWTRDGQTLFTPCGAVVKSMNVDTGAPGFTLGSSEDSSSVTSVRLAPTDRFIVVAYSNLLIKQYTIAQKPEPDEEVLPNAEAVTLERQWKSQHRAPIMVMEFCDDASLLATGSADFSIKVWNLTAQYCTHTLTGGQSVVTRMVFYDTDALAAGFAEGDVRMWDLTVKDSAKRLKVEWKAHTSHVTGLVLQNDQLIVASRDQTATVFDLTTLKKLKTVPLFEAVESFDSAVGVDETGGPAAALFASVGEEGTLKLWDLATGRAVRTAKLVANQVEQLLVCRERNQYVLVTADHNLLLVDGQSLQAVKQFVGFNDEILDVAFVGDESERERCLLVATNSPELRLYDRLDWSCKLIPGHSDSVLSIDCAPWNRQIFASGAKDNAVIVWRNSSKKKEIEKLSKATGHTNSVSAVKFGRLGKPKFLLTVSHDTTLKIWPLNGVAFGEAPKKKAERTDADATETLSASCTVVAHTKDLTALDVSPNDRLCATASLDKTVKLWHIDLERLTFASAGAITGHKRGVWDVRFSDTDQVVATASGDCTVKIFALVDRTCVKTFEGHPSAVLQVRFLSGGQQLLSADSGGLLKLWTIRSNECTKTIEAHDDKIWALLPTADSSKVITGGSDARLLVWDDVSEKERLEAEKKRSERVAQEQQLANLLEQNRFTDALRLTLKLGRPFSALKVVEQLVALEGDENALRSSINDLKIDQVALLLEYASGWNTNSRNAHTAQRVLFEVLSSFPPAKLMDFPNIKGLIESFLPYTQRHFERLSRAKQQATFLEYTWQRMRLSDIDSPR